MRNLRADKWNPSQVSQLALALIVLAGLAIDAYTHFDLASRYDANQAEISQGTLFRIEAAVAVAAGLLLGVIRSWWTTLASVGVLAGGAFLVVLYYYANIGEIGPLPNMYEPVWYTEKVVSLVGEAVGAAAALLLLWIQLRRRAPVPAHAGP